MADFDFGKIRTNTNKKFCPKLSLGERLKSTAAARTTGAKAEITGS
jgi:hypothetical protein